MTLDAADALFMDELFADLDSSHFSIPPSQSPPKKRPTSPLKSPQQHRISPNRSGTTPRLSVRRARSPLKDSTLFQSQSFVERDLEDWFQQPSTASRRTTPTFGPKRQKIDQGNTAAVPHPPPTAKASHTTRKLLDLDSDQTPAQCSYTRCRVLALVEGNYEVDVNGSSFPKRTRPERLLVLEIDRHGKNANQTSPRKVGTETASSNEHAEVLLASLRDDWLQTMVAVGNIVHLVGEFENDTRTIPIVLDQQSKQDSMSTPDSATRAKVEIAIEQSAKANAHSIKPSGCSSTVESDDDDLWDDLASMPSLSQCATQELLASADAPKAKVMIFASRSSTSPGSDEVDHALDNLLVIHPDVLVPATKVADVASCIRKPVVQDRLRGASDVTINLVMGNMLHELLQACLTASPPTSARIPRASGDDGKSVIAPSTCASLAPSPWPECWHGIGNFSRSFVEDQIEEQVRSNIESLYAIELSAAEATSQLREKAAPFAHFARTFLLRESDATFHPEATLRESGRPSGSAQAKVRLGRILDVEEEIWSPVFGLKGKIDVSVKCDILETSHSPTSEIASTRSDKAFSLGHLNTPRREELARRITTSIVPLELKTGRAEVVSTEHRAQTMLYTLMMSDRYKVHVSDGLLYYSKSGELHRISRSRNEVRSLIIGRNELAHYLRHDSSSVGKPNCGEAAPKPGQVLPPTIDSEFKCRRCYAVDGCMLYRKAVEQVVEPSEAGVVDIEGSGAMRIGNVLAKRSPIADVYEQKTQHLNQVHLAFFRKWDRLLNLEEEDAVRFRREMWTMTAEQREKVGRCFGNMRLDFHSEVSSCESSSSMRRVVHRFIRHHEFTQDMESSLLSGHMTVNDPVTISIEPDMLSVAQGFITNLTPTSVEIGLDHSLNAAMQRALEMRNGQEDAEPFDAVAAAEKVVFRIDKDELGSGMGRVRANLASLFVTPQRGGDVKRRELIVEMRPPRFRDAEHLEKALECDLESNTVQKIIAQVYADARLNQDQKLAIAKVLAADDYALVLGMPGTGKTTTIAKLIQLLVKLGKRILLTSYTHSAVDTILRKLAQDGFDQNEKQEMTGVKMRILRLGNKDKVHPDARQFLLPRCTTLQQLKEAFESPNVVAATCLSVHHSFFSSGLVKKLGSQTRTDQDMSASAYMFDYCIVDEASQIPLPTCLGPLRFADKFVLVGDHHQLAPLVKNATAREGGLDISLFKLLWQKYGHEAMVALRTQYRMNEDIMHLSNQLVYGGQLRVGSKMIQDQTLVLSNLEAAIQEAGHQGWMVDLLQPETKVRWLDTSQRRLEQVGESKQGDLVKNAFEAAMVVRIASVLIAGGCRPDQIAVVTPYREQIKLLRTLFIQHTTRPNLQHIELLTADQSQGRDKDVILVTFTRANYSPTTTGFNSSTSSRPNTGDLLNDLRRLNVTLTRAKSKLILLGHTYTLQASAVLEPLIQLITKQGWLRNI